MPTYPFDPQHVMSELSRADRKLARAIRRIGPFPIEGRKPRPPFECLLEAIFYQQITGKAAQTILGRVKALFDERRMPKPAEILAAPRAKLRRAGLSRQKIAAAKDLAKKTLDGTVPSLREIRRMGDDEIIARLTAVHGIGEWSAQMFMIAWLLRPDILPVDDYGLRKGFAELYGHKEVPKPKVILEHGERWRPYRSIASWYLWRVADQTSPRPKKKSP